jgi:hypothetical protein
VSRFGVLDFLPFQSEYPQNVYAGRLFVKPKASGHMFVQHYLNPMFGPENSFLDADVEVAHVRSEELTEPVPPGRTVRELSRLASYLDGETPEG